MNISLHLTIVPQPGRAPRGADSEGPPREQTLRRPRVVFLGGALGMALCGERAGLGRGGAGSGLRLGYTWTAVTGFVSWSGAWKETD